MFSVFRTTNFRNIKMLLQNCSVFSDPSGILRFSGWPTRTTRKAKQIFICRIFRRAYLLLQTIHHHRPNETFGLDKKKKKAHNNSETKYTSFYSSFPVATSHTLKTWTGRRGNRVQSHTVGDRLPDRKRTVHRGQRRCLWGGGGGGGLRAPDAYRDMQWNGWREHSVNYSSRRRLLIHS